MLQKIAFDDGQAEQSRAKLELDLHETRLFGKESARSFKELIANHLEAKQKLKGIVRLQYACKPLLEYFGNADRQPNLKEPMSSSTVSGVPSQ